MRAIETRCEEARTRVCQFQFGRVAGSVIAGNATSPVTGVMLFVWDTESDADAFTTMLMLMILLEPQADREERIAVITTLSGMVPSARGERSARLRNTRITTTPLAGAGVGIALDRVE